MRVNRYLHIFLILVLATSQLAASLHAVEHLGVPHDNSQSSAHSHDRSDNQTHADGVLFSHNTAHDHSHSHPHSHPHPHPPSESETENSLEPDCLAYHVHLNLCAFAASTPSHFRVPPLAAKVPELAQPELLIGRVTHRSIRGPPALS